MILIPAKRGAVMRPESVRFKKKSQVTIPKDFVDELNLQEGDQLECRLEDGKIVFVPTVAIAKDQAWFWSNEWQKEELEVEAQITDGRISAPMSLDDTLDQLDGLMSPEK